MATLFVIEAFGRHAPGERPQQAPAALLLDVFEARAELMGWSCTSRPARGRNLWDLYEADLADAPGVIGSVYGELADPPDSEGASLPSTMPEEGSPVRPVAFSKPPSRCNASVGLSVALPPLVQCFVDALRRTADVDVAGIQLTCYQAAGGPGAGRAGGLASSGRWFNASRQAPVDAVIAFDEGLLGGNPPEVLANQVRRMRTGDFSFGPVVAVPDLYRCRMPVDTPYSEVPVEPAEYGLAVSMPEWSGSAIGWTMAAVIDGARSIVPDAASFAVRVTLVD